MFRLLVGDLVANARIWLGTALVAAVTAAVLAVDAALIETGAAVGGDVGLALYGISGTVLLSTAVAAVVVLGTVANLTVTLQQRGYALWQLVGLSTGRIRSVVSAQLLVVALLGGAVGCAVAAPALQPFYDVVFDGTPDLGGLRLRFGGVAAVSVVALVGVLVVLSGSRAAGRAGRVPVIRVLREPDPPRQRMGAARWSAAVAVLAVLVSVTSSLRSTPLDRLVTPLMLIAPLLAALFAAVGPRLFGPLLSGWTRLLPAAASASWFLARHSTRQNLGRSTATISPLLVAIALTGGLYAATRTVAGATEIETGDVPPALSSGSVLLVLGGPLLLSLVGAAVTVAMSSSARQRESALVQAAGGTPGTVLLAAAAEAVVYVGTALLLGVVAVAATALAGSWAAQVPGASPSFPVGPVAVTAGVGFLLVLVATVVPTALALRRDVPAVLAAE